MREFILKMYQDENFPIYLGIIIVILVITFFIVLFLGRKDKKNIENTQKLSKVDDNAFGDLSNPIPVEAPVFPALEETPVMQMPTQNIASPVLNNEVVSEPANNYNYMSNVASSPVMPEMTPQVTPELTPASNENNADYSMYSNPTMDFDAIAASVSVYEKVTPNEVVTPSADELAVSAQESLNNVQMLTDFIKKDIELLEETPAVEEEPVMPRLNESHVSNGTSPLLEQTLEIELPKLKNND